MQVVLQAINLVGHHHEVISFILCVYVPLGLAATTTYIKLDAKDWEKQRHINQTISTHNSTYMNSSGTPFNTHDVNWIYKNNEARL